MKITVRGSVFETNSSSEHSFMYLSKEMFEKWRRGEVEIKGGGYPVYDLADDDFTTTKKRPHTVFDPQTNEHPDEEWFSDYLDAIDNPEVKEDLLYVMRKHSGSGRRYIDNGENWDGSYISMLMIFLRHHGECVIRKQANKRYVDPEEWEPEYDEVLAAFRKAMHEIEEWEGIDDEKFAEFRKAVNDLREKEEITDEDISALESILSDMSKYKIEDEKFAAFRDAFDVLESHDIVYQESYIDVRDNGKNVRIHIWGRDDG